MTPDGLMSLVMKAGPNLWQFGFSLGQAALELIAREPHPVFYSGASAEVTRVTEYLAAWAREWSKQPTAAIWLMRRHNPNDDILTSTSYAEADRDTALLIDMTDVAKQRAMLGFGEDFVQLRYNLTEIKPTNSNVSLARHRAGQPTDEAAISDRFLRPLRRGPRIWSALP